MNFKRNIKILNKFKKDIELLKRNEKTDLKSLLDWVKKRQKNIKSSSKLINLDQCEDWFFDSKKNLYHKSGQFFRVKGVKIAKTIVTISSL